MSNAPKGRAARRAAALPFSIEEKPFDPKQALVDAQPKLAAPEPPIVESDSPFLDVPVRPLSVTFPAPAVRVAGRWLTAFLMGDTHHGVQCDKTLSVVEAMVEDSQPNKLIDMGDGVDAGHLSEKFKVNPFRTTSLQDEINAKRIQLARFRDKAPNAEYLYLEGNHEERLKRTMWNAQGPSRALMQLDVTKKFMTWPTLLGLDDLHIKFFPYDDQTPHELLPKFIVKHGTKVCAKAGFTAHAELTKYGRSGASGHTHRLAAVWQRDHNGQHVWIETGCCALLTPEYTQDPDWANGCVFLTFDTKTGAVSPEIIEIRNGHTLWRGQEYTA